MSSQNSQQTADILRQFQNLSSSGMLNSVENLKKENIELSRIIEDTATLISFTNVDSMIQFIISKFLEYFIPEYLIFIIKPPRRKHTRQFFYNRLNLEDSAATTTEPKYFFDFKRIFDSDGFKFKSGVAYRFEEISLLLPDRTCCNDLKKYSPEFIIPLIGIGGAYGLVFLSEKITGTTFSKNELSYIQRIFSVFAVTLQNGLHYETSITDPKTGLFTYDFFFTRTKETISMINRYKGHAGMLIIDIDFFKKFNDTWGHLCGDKVLVAIAEVLKKSVRSEDCVARFGGEEFSVLLTQCTPESIRLVAERIRHAIENTVVYEKEVQLSITASVGGCVIRDIAGLTPKHIFRKADQALYYSKEHGRNQTTIYNIGLLDLAKIMNNEVDDIYNDTED